MLIDYGNLHIKKIAAVKIAFPPKPDATYGWTFFIQKLTSLLKSHLHKENIVTSFGRKYVKIKHILEHCKSNIINITN